MQNMSSRLFFLPVNTGYYSLGSPTQNGISFYEKRSKDSLYCSIVGNVATKSGFGTNSRTGVISDNQSWKKLSQIIKQGGTKPGIQLARTWPNYIGQRCSINRKWEEYRVDVIEGLKQLDLSEIYDDFYASINLAKSMGFEHIQIHAAHGYLLSSMLDPQLYDACDDVINLIINLVSEFKNTLELSVRVSVYCGFSQQVENDRLRILKSLFYNTFDFVDLSEGYYNYNKNYIYPQ